jgi:hypothetical protein
MSFIDNDVQLASSVAVVGLGRDYEGTPIMIARGLLFFSAYKLPSD